MIRSFPGRTILCLILAAGAAFAADEPSSWHLVWSDEFDGERLDETKWRIEDAALVKNNERQYYAPDEVYLEDGNLVLRSRKRAVVGREYTSGLVETKGKFAQRFGKFEIRAKLPRTQGLWPAHWMLPADGSWPPEIDIMELVGSEPHVITMSLHNGEWPNLDSQSADHMGPDYTAGFHTYTLEWTPDRIAWLIDGTERFATQDGVPQKAFYLILNTAVGGHMPGDPDDTTELPQYHHVDYVRVYARETPGTFFLTTAAEHGRVAASPRDEENRCAAGSAVALKATPSIGYRFARWSGDLEGSENPATIAMDAHKHIVAHFDADPDAPILLSKGKPAAASSAEDEKTPAEFAFDGDPRSRWSSRFSDPQWLTVDLGERHEINAFRILWENAYARAYRIEVSDDGETWTTVQAKGDARGGTEEIINVKGSGRYVRLTGTERATEWGYSVWEFEVYGRALPAAPTPASPD